MDSDPAVSASGGPAIPVKLVICDYCGELVEESALYVHTDWCRRQKR